MSVKMQGLWLVKVKSKSASFPQEFKIEGASVGNGTYPGDLSTPEIFVSGTNWSINILNNPGSGFIPSDTQIKFPVSAGGFYSFDIQSNDAGGDEDFNDLILTCRTPVGANDYIIYGNLNYYSGICFNPCFRRSIVIDSVLTLKEALKNPSLKEIIQAYYPGRVDQLKTRANIVALNPQPLPPGPGDPFIPMLIPLDGQTPIPAKQQHLVRSKTETFSPDTKSKNAGPVQIERLVSSEKKSADTVFSNRISVSDNLRQAASGIADRFRLQCESGVLPGSIINILQYNRSVSELAGSAYAGDGTRDFEGQTVTDRNGNYIFRFTMTSTQTVNEILYDTAAGENAVVQSAPDILVQLVCPGSAIPAFESLPFWNINHLQRIDLCIPKPQSCLVPFACDGQHILQGIGNIVLGPPAAGGERIGANNFLNGSGMITAFNSLAPAARCAAWYGTLLLRGCLKNPVVKYYKLAYRTNTLFSTFSAFTQPFSLPRFIGPTLIESPVFDTTRDAYLNVENDPGDWLISFRNIKAQINAAAFANGSYIFRIEGFDNSMHAVAGTVETLPVYIDNAAVKSDISPEITMDGAGTLGECALFTLPVSGGTVIENPGITVRFRAIHNFSSSVGFMNSYGLSMLKGSGGFSFVPGSAAAQFPSPPFLDSVINSGRFYVHGDNLNCNTYFRGTINEISADADGYYAVTLQPASGGWLETGQQFCAFAISLSYQLRLTDGQGLYPNLTSSTVLIGIQRP